MANFLLRIMEIDKATHTLWIENVTKVSERLNYSLEIEADSAWVTRSNVSNEFPPKQVSLGKWEVSDYTGSWIEYQVQGMKRLTMKADVAFDVREQTAEGEKAVASNTTNYTWAGRTKWLWVALAIAILIVLVPKSKRK